MEYFTWDTAGIFIIGFGFGMIGISIGITIKEYLDKRGKDATN